MKLRLVYLASLLPLISPRLAAAQTAELVVPFNAAALEFPTSIALDRSGNCFLGMAATSLIKKVTPTGAQSVFAKIDDARIQGLAFDFEGNLLVAGAAGIWKVTPAGTAGLWAKIGPGVLHDLAVDSLGNIYATCQPDDRSGAIWKIDARGNASLWFASPLLAPAKSFLPAPVGASGLALDLQQWTLYTTVTGTGRILEIKINSDGSAGAARIVVENAALVGASALRLDDRGNFYTAVSLTNRITKITPDGSITDLAAGGMLSSPASLALDIRGGRTNLYVCNNGNSAAGEDRKSVV